MVVPYAVVVAVSTLASSAGAVAKPATHPSASGDRMKESKPDVDRMACRALTI